VEARRGIEHHVARGQLHLVDAIVVLHRQLAAVVLVGLRQEQRARKVGADADRGPGDPADSAVDVGAEKVAFPVAVEQRGKDSERYGC